MPRQKRPETILVGYRITPEIRERLKAEAEAEGLWPAEVLELRVRHSYAIAPKLPRKTA